MEGRCLAAEARIPKYLARWKRGAGTRAASFSSNSPSLMVTCVVPSRQDTSSIPGGEYQFAWRLPDFDWQYYPIAIR